jgi:hypothetical protein
MHCVQVDALTILYHKPYHLSFVQVYLDRTAIEAVVSILGVGRCDPPDFEVGNEWRE